MMAKQVDLQALLFVRFSAKQRAFSNICHGLCLWTVWIKCMTIGIYSMQLSNCSALLA